MRPANMFHARIYIVAALGVVCASLIITDHLLAAYSVELVLLALVGWGILETRRAGQRARAAGLQLIDLMLRKTMEVHREAGDGQVGYCAACPDSPSWPCAQYLTALTVASMPERQRIKDLERGRITFEMIDRRDY